MTIRIVSGQHDLVDAPWLPTSPLPRSTMGCKKVSQTLRAPFSRLFSLDVVLFSLKVPDVVPIANGGTSSCQPRGTRTELFLVGMDRIGQFSLG